MLTLNAAARGQAAYVPGLLVQSPPDTRQNNPRNNSHTQAASTERGLFEVMQKQNAITEMLVKQQTRSYLPSKDVPVFKGDPLTYKSFIRAFDHAVDNRADSYQDKLYYLEQYTSGEPQELVRSCEHMLPERGYKEARRLLKRQYGDELKIANAYMDKALRWPQIKPEDGKALSAYALFLIGCRNTMDDIEFMEEMDNPTNMRVVISKLPYKIREKWRTAAFEIHEEGRGRARFSHLVDFIDRQAKVALDPLFGDVLEGSQTIKGKEKGIQEQKLRKTGQRESTFFTGVQDTAMEATVKKSNPVKDIVSAFHKPCLFCQKNHALSVCHKIKELKNTERINFLKSKGLCFGCLTFGHLSKTCRKRLKCQTCSQSHPDILHVKTVDNCGSEKTEENNTENDIVASAYVSLGQESRRKTGAGEDECVLAVVPVQLKSRKSERYVETYALIDPGSTATFCTEDIQRKLNLKGKNTQFLLDTMAQVSSEGHKLMKSVVLTDLEVRGLEENTYIELPKVFTHSYIPVKKDNIPRQEDIAQWQYLKEVHLPRIQADVGMLIGANVPKAIEPWQVINSDGKGPYAIKTALGWVINGPLRRDDNPKTESGKLQSFTANRIQVCEIEELLVKQYNADFPERSREEKEEMSQDDCRFMHLVSSSAKVVDGHYSLRLPLRNENIKMPNNRGMAQQRADNLKRKLKKNPDFHKDYVTFMRDIIDKGYAEKITARELSRSDNRVWYIPHHGVYHPKKKKLRVAFDCTASYQGVSLNEELLQGPDLTNSLIGVLLRFREHPVALMADVESMFYQVKVPKEDTDLLRFLWWPNGDLNSDVEEYRMNVHLFGATSSPSCASYALRKTAEDAKGVMSPEAVDTVLRHFYVDDCLKAVETSEEAINLVQELSALCTRGGFRLTKWVSNSKKVLACIPEEERAPEVKDLDLGHNTLPLERALGVQWCTETDRFTFQINTQRKPVTRRGILSTVNSVFDPLGFLSPLVLPAKLILRELCKEKYGWDEEIQGEHARKWQEWLTDLEGLTELSIPRCIKTEAFGATQSAQLHHFADASEDGYATTSYILLTNHENEKHCSLVLGKARVTPLKHVTIPRLELMAAVVAVKMDRMLRQELKIPLQESTFWTDSTTVLKYLSNEGARFKTFVANRVTTIRDHSHPNQWRHVNSELNPADQGSRGVKVQKFLQSMVWIHGPDFLMEPETEWPKQLVNKCLTTEEDTEIKTCARVIMTSAQENFDMINKLIAYYSTWQRLKRAVAWFLRLKETLILLKNKRKELQTTISHSQNDPEKQDKLVAQSIKKFRSTIQQHPLSLEELVEAETKLIRISQQQDFTEEIHDLQEHAQIKKKSQIYKLDPVWQNSILRVGGRLNKAAMPQEAKHPAILSKASPIANLILQHIHQEVGHCGRNYMLSVVREKYWIPQANSAVRRIISKCIVCRRLNAKAGKQKMADLPEDRLLPDQPPFTNVGVDFFGPFEIRRGRSFVKRYGVIFTCLTVRAVHIEIAHSLDTDSCINVIRRFIARRGQVKIMRSDNGTNFVAAEKELIQNTMTEKLIKWIFNTPAASHQGGTWERQIHTVRKVLNSVLRQQILDDEGLQTIMCEVEAIINNRPITHSSDDYNDVEALTPNHLLLMKTQPNIPPGVFDKDDQYARRRWRQIQYMANLFWTRWTREYLPLLQERQ